MMWKEIKAQKLKMAKCFRKYFHFYLFHSRASRFLRSLIFNCNWSNNVANGRRCFISKTNDTKLEKTLIIDAAVSACSANESATKIKFHKICSSNVNKRLKEIKHRIKRTNWPLVCGYSCRPSIHRNPITFWNISIALDSCKAWCWLTSNVYFKWTRNL